MHQLVDVRAAGQEEPGGGQPGYFELCNSRCFSILKRILLCFAMLSFVLALSLQRAQAQTAEGFVGWKSSAMPSGAFPSAEAACRAQWQYYMGGGGSRFIRAIPRPDDPNTQDCSWTHYGYLCDSPNGCFALLPGHAFFECASGYTPTLGTYCVKGIPERPCECNEGTVNPTVGNPIVLATGSKVVTARDFSTSDGAFTISRSYRSLPGASVGAKFLPVGLGGNWRFDFGYELQLGVFSGSPTSPNAKITLMAPDGSAYDFLLQSNGAWVPDTTTGASFAPTNLKLEYIGTLPSNLAEIRSNPSQWRLTDGDDTVWTFQTFTLPNKTWPFLIGRPTSRTTRGGYQWEFAYRQDTSLETITDSFGRQATFNWSIFHISMRSDLSAEDLPFPEAISSVGLPDGTTLRYSYDPPPATTGPSTGAIQRLVKVERLNAASAVVDSTTYAYADARHPRHITSVTDHRNIQVATYAYDARGRAVSTSKGGGADAYTVEYGETSTEHSRRVINPLGKAAVYHFTKFGGAGEYRLTSVEGEASTNCPSTARSITYGTDNFIASQVDAEGRTTAFTRDSRGRPLTVTEAVGTSLARTTSFTWHSTLNVPTVITTPGLTQSRTYASGKLSEATLTDTTTITTPYPTNGRTRTLNYDWTPTGLLNFVDGPLPGDLDRISYTYNSAGYVQTSTNEVGNVSEVTSRNGSGAPLTLQDANGVQTVITYDAMGRPLTVTVNPGSAQSQHAMEYDNDGNLTKVILPGGGWLSCTYDAARRVTRIDNNRGEYQTFVLNGIGQPTSQATRNAGGAITMQRSNVYDELGRVIQSIGAGSQTTAFQYDKENNLVQVTDARSKQWATGWDALNRAVTKTDPTTAQSDYAYAANDALTQFQDGRNVTTDRVVDGFGHTIYENSPDRGARTYWYDEAGRLTKILAPDAPANGTPDEVLAYTYDSAGSGNVGAGRLTAVTDPSGNSAFTYDAQGRLTAEQKTIQSQAYQLAYGYDANGSLTSITYPSGHVITYVRATDGRVTSVRSQVSSGGAFSDLATSVTYAPFGPLKSLTYGNGLALTRSYDQNYWLTGIGLAGSTTLLDLAFTRDGNGNVTAVTDNASSGRAASYSYTDNDRLGTAAGAWGSDAYTWDASGNRTRADRTISGVTDSDVATIASGSNRLTEMRDGSGTLSKAFSLSAGGAMAQQAVVGGSTFDYVYSARQRLAAVKLGGVGVGSYLYDYAGRRVVSTTSAQTIHYVYGPGGMLLAEHDGATGALLKEYVWLDDMPLAQVTGTVSTPVHTYVHTGQIGEPILVTNGSQAKVWDVAVDPWGNALSLSTPTVTQNLRFPGQSLQAESGLFQNWHRDYDPTLGRYIEADPIGLDGGSNLFAYADGNPIKYTDPFGLSPLAVVGGALLIDLAVPEPTDLIPHKWLGWGGALATAGIVTIFCKENADSEEERCRKVVKRCKELCTDRLLGDGSPLPGVGSDRVGRWRRCVRECTEAHGCKTF